MHEVPSVPWIWTWVFYQDPWVDFPASSRARAVLVALLKAGDGGSMRGMGRAVAACEGTAPDSCTSGPNTSSLQILKHPLLQNCSSGAEAGVFAEQAAAVCTEGGCIRLRFG